MLNRNIDHELASTQTNSSSASPLLAQAGALNGLTPPVLRSNFSAHTAPRSGSMWRRGLRRLSIGVLALLTAAIVYLLLVNLVWTGLPTGAASPQFAGTALDGSQVDLAQQQGQPVMLTFWSPDCFACREE
ncbi:MAG: redoxin domain-containing protein, partial [Caldilineaceae bacterium]|nr:redoxin domain-containing protein [Caldilineaceae bacterium]